MENPNVGMPQPESDDVQANKAIAIVGYIIFFIPLLAARNSRFAMYHGNQALVLFLTALILNIVLGIIPIIGWILLPIVNIVIFVFAILGIVNAANGNLKPLPLIGGIQIIK